MKPPTRAGSPCYAGGSSRNKSSLEKQSSSGHTSDNFQSMDATIYRLKYRDILTLCVIALLCLGIVMVQSASMRVTGQARWQWTPTGIQQIKMALIALITYGVVGRIDYARLGRRSEERR